MLPVKTKNAFLQKAKDLGATAAKFVAVRDIPLGAWTRLKCQFGCGSYGKNLCCPPYTPDAERMKTILADYGSALLIQYACELKNENDWEEIDGKMSYALLDILLELEKAAFIHNYYKAFALKAGCCALCKACTLTQCRFPYKARPSMEACGIDVFALTKKAGMAVKVLPEKTKNIVVYGLILIE